jgi:hypothetical protein
MGAFRWSMRSARAAWKCIIEGDFSVIRPSSGADFLS